MALATLSIDLVAKLASLQEGLDKAGRISAKAAADVEARWAKAGQVASAAMAALGGAAVVTGLVNIARNSINAIDALNDVADATGASVENISALEDVALRTGTNLDTVSGVLVKFNSVLKEAKPGSGQEAALKAIGLSAEELKRLDPAEALRQTAVALSGYADDGDKARLTQELFGKSVKDAAPFLKDLAEQGQLNATVTKAQAEEAERFNLQMFELQKNFADLARGIVSDAIPAINDFFSAYKRLSENGGVLSGLGKILGADFKTAQVQAATEEVERLQAAIAGTNGQGFYGRANLAQLNGELAEAKKTLRDLQGEAGKSRAALNAALGVSPAGGGRGFVSPDLAKPRDSVGPLPDADKPAKAAAAALSEYDKLIAKIGDKTAAQRLEADQERALTETQRLGLEVQRAMESGALKTTAAQRAKIDAMLSELAALDALTAGRKADLDWLAKSADENAAAVESGQRAADAAYAQADALRLAGEEIGKSAAELADLTAQRLRDRAASLDGKASALEDVDASSARAAAYRDEANALRGLADQGKANAAKTSRAGDKAFAESLVSTTQQGQINALGADYAKLERAFQAGDISAAKYSDALGVLDDKFVAITEGAKTAADQVSTFADEAARNIQGVLGSAFEDIFRGKFDNIGQMFGDLLIKMAAQAAAANVAESLFGKGGKGDGGLLQTALQFFGSQQANGGAWSNGVQMFARGDVFNSPTAFGFSGGLGVLGEAGPEAVMPLRRGADGKLGVAAAGQGGQAITIQINQTVGDLVTSAQLAQVAERTRQAAIAGVADARRRGGA